MKPNNPDPGLLSALKLPGLPDGLVLDLGCGTGDYLVVLAARFGESTVGVESIPEICEYVTQRLTEENVLATVQCQNIFDMEFEPESIAVLTVGAFPYWPKETVRKQLARFWTAMKPNATITFELFLSDDWARTSPFIAEGCSEVEPGSYAHYCHSQFCHNTMAGRIGGSFWDITEAWAMVETLGNARLVHSATYRWEETINEDAVDVARSVMVMTIQKLPD